jgi:hypothetical protein
MNIKNFNNFKNDSLNEGLFDYFKKRKIDKDFQKRVKEINDDFKSKGVVPKFKSSGDGVNSRSNWIWSDLIYGTRVNFEIRLAVGISRFICDVPSFPSLSFKNDFSYKVNPHYFAGGLDCKISMALKPDGVNVVLMFLEVLVDKEQ